MAAADLDPSVAALLAASNQTNTAPSAPSASPLAQTGAASGLDPSVAALLAASNQSGTNPPGTNPPGTNPPGTSGINWGQQLAAPFQAAASLATGALAPAAAAAQNLIQGKTSPADYAKARSEWQYTPTNPVAQMDLNAVTWPFRKTIGAVTGQLGDVVAQKTGGNVSSQQVQDLINTGLMALPGLRGGKATEAATAVSPEVQEATAAGLKLTPEQAGGGLMARAVQGLAGSAKLERSISKANAPVINQLAAQEIGANSLKPADISAAKAPPIATYRAARTAGPVPLNPSDFSSVKAAGTLKDPAVQALQDHYAGMGSIDANDLVSDLSQLRSSAAKNIKAPFAPNQNALGWAQKSAATALEDALQRQLQTLGAKAPVSLSDFQNARQTLAKIHSVEDAMSGPNVSAQALYKQAARGVPLSGNLRTIANAYENFDRSLQGPGKIRDSGPVNFSDLLVGGLAALHHPPAALAMFARPLARGVLASKAYQGNLAGRAAPSGAPGGLGLFGSTALAAPLLNQQQQQGLLGP